MEDTFINTGLLPQAPADADWMAGAESGIVFEERLVSGDWSPYLPTEESQIGLYFDTMGCVTFSALNCIEMQINYLIANNKLRQSTITALKDLGFMDENGKFNASDRFTAKMSGTTHAGNYFVSVWDSIRKDGLVSEADWGYPRTQRQPVFDWNDFYAPIPQPVKDKAKKFLDLFEVSYEWIPAQINYIRDHLRHTPLQIGAPTCPPWNTENLIGWCSAAVANHATSVYALDHEIRDFDHYTPYKKHLALNYPIMHVMKGLVREKGSTTPVAPQKLHHVFDKDLFFGQTSLDVKALQDYLKWDGVMSTKVASTGFYGTITAAAVRAFQVKHSVAPASEIASLNGRRVGAKTRATLNAI